MFTKKQNLKLHHNIFDRLLESLKFMRFCPNKILELGFLDPYVKKKLAIFYPKAKIYSLSINKYISCKSFLRTCKIFSADYKKLPLLNNSVDLVISNLAINVLDHKIEQYFQEIHRIISTDGLLLFSIFNNDPNKQSKEELENFENDKVLINLGNLLYKNKFIDPVIERELIYVGYKIQSKNKKGLINKTIPIDLIYGRALGEKLIKIDLI